MYTIRVSYGHVDEPEMATVESLGTYVSRGEACEAAQGKFDAINARLGDDLEVRFGEIEGGRRGCYVTYGYYDANLGRLVAGYDHYYHVSVIER